MLLLNTGNGSIASYHCNSEIKESAMHLQGDLGAEPTAMEIPPRSLRAHTALPPVQALASEDLVLQQTHDAPGPSVKLLQGLRYY